MTNKKSKEKQRLKTVQNQFADWRNNRKGRNRIPESLWKSAASLADTFSICEISKLLRLNHTALKRRVEAMQDIFQGEPCRPTFIEFPPLNTPTDSNEVSLELEKAGVTMKVHAKGHIDVLSLIQTFWSQQP